MVVHLVFVTGGASGAVTRPVLEINGTKIGGALEEAQKTEHGTMAVSYQYARKDIASYTVLLMKNCVTNVITTRRGVSASGELFDIVNETMYKTVYYNEAKQVIAVQITFDNIGQKRLDEIKKTLEDKYRREVQHQHNVYTYDTGQGIRVRAEVSPTAYKDSFNKKAAYRFRMVVFYYEPEMLDNALSMFNKKSDVQLKDVL
jgi:hypothetical protein